VINSCAFVSDSGIFAMPKKRSGFTVAGQRWNYTSLQFFRTDLTLTGRMILGKTLGFASPIKIC
jgi:hypothetical protein